MAFDLRGLALRLGLCHYVLDTHPTAGDVGARQPTFRCMAALDGNGMAKRLTATDGLEHEQRNRIMTEYPRLSSAGLRGAKAVAREQLGRKDTEREYLTMFGGIAVYCNPALLPGTVQFRNADGEVIGTILNVKQIDTGGRCLNKGTARMAGYFERDKRTPGQRLISEELTKHRNDLAARRGDLETARKRVIEREEAIARLETKVEELERDSDALTRGYVAAMSTAASAV